MEITFLFWNLMRQPLSARVGRIVATHSVDIVLFAESIEDPEEICSALGSSFTFPDSFGDKVRLFMRAGIGEAIEQFTSKTGGLSIRRLRLNGVQDEVLLAIVHFPSRVNYDREDQLLEATSMIQEICRVEDRLSNTRTILTGDLNMNPFDTGVIGAQAIHSVMTKDLARRQEREVQGRSYRLFYNPMWGYFGDRTTGPPGTYYLHSSKPGNHFWHMFDQVLLRPSLMDNLCDLRILDSDGVESLVTRNGLPKKSISDHLPLLFKLEV